MKEEDYQFYMDLRKYGSTRHAGFGLGFERCIMYLTGMTNIRDVTAVPENGKQLRIIESVQGGKPTGGFLYEHFSSRR